MDFLIREASPDDADLIADLTCNAWNQTVAANSSGHHETSARVLDDLRLGGGFILLVDDVAAGSVRWLPTDTEHDIWEIIRMGVTHAFRGQSLSQHLLEAVIHHALGCDVTELRLAVRTDQPRLIDFYAALGFEIAPELEYSHASPQEPALTVMRRVLRR
ncbi:GNAT family N-acetyltransferase [Herminiimonas sp. CN]|uniref:GNAT family N-acetyltransferase n=1 Tax=Herminiimonas sp. CN TaxID=1349818 RepID=UPI000473E2FA|nr:GNAT family N-acetyltransferase [Herminiimonas sp. CN]